MVQRKDQNTARAIKILMEMGRCASTLLLLTSNISKSQKDLSSSNISLPLRSWCRGKVSHHQGLRLYSWKCLEILYEDPAMCLWLEGEVFKNVALGSVVVAWLRGVKGLRQCWGAIEDYPALKRPFYFLDFFCYLIILFSLLNYFCAPQTLFCDGLVVSP